jgi:hypothetical protein|tara:strand:- start:6957 stop:7862 length:906 start_codon:yes stop_codon:yes gene_type:complete
MAISRQQLAKELEPGLNALFGLEYKQYENQHTEIFETESSDRAFEEEVMLSGFENASVKAEGAAIVYDNAQETFTARYQHETVALAFALTEENIEDNLYDKISTRYTKALARSMANTKQVKAANVLNRAFNANFLGGDGVELCSNVHPTIAGTFKNEPTTSADLSETSLEQAMIDIAAMTDERGLKIAARGMKMIIHPNQQFVAERLMKSGQRPGTADNDVNALKSMGMIPQGFVVNNFLSDTESFFIKTDVPNGMKHMVRAPIKTAMEGDFETGNVRYKARERYSFGWSDPRGIYGNPGA